MNGLRRAAALLALAGPALLAPPAAAQGAAELRPGYRVGPKDLLEIRVFEVPELNRLELRVSDEGTIQLPIIGEFRVQGLTDNEIGQRLKALLESRYLQRERATVSVQVREYRSRPISVIGAVRQPGPLAFSGRWTLLEVLTAAGGLAENHGDVIYVLRRAENGLSDQIAIRVRGLMLEADPTLNIPIFANDLINVPADVAVTIYCLGEVGRPGALTFKTSERISLLSAVARAGGLTERASRKITIRRRVRDGSEKELTVDYGRIVKGKDPDVELQEGDVVVVKESFF